MADAAFGGAGAGGGGAGVGGAGGAAMGKDVESAGSVPCLVCAASAGEVMADEAARKEMPWRYCDVCGTMYDDPETPMCMACLDIVTMDTGPRGDWYNHTYQHLMERRESGCAESEHDKDHSRYDDTHKRDGCAFGRYRTMGVMNKEYTDSLTLNGTMLLHWNILEHEDRKQLRADLRTAMAALIKLHKTLAAGREKYETRWCAEEKSKAKVVT